MVKVRSKTVEPVLGTLINFLNMKRINTRGIQQANKHVLMAAMTYKLKKYLKFIAKKPKSLAQVVSINQSREGKYFFKSHFFEVKTNVFMPSFFKQQHL
ncbi:transposase [Flavobacterium macrobrachii]|uniref:transposase n=1 Tax=Flavobacterium macrobrachii TaxID=591204 RepID=UPI001EF30225